MNKTIVLLACLALIGCLFAGGNILPSPICQLGTKCADPCSGITKATLAAGAKPTLAQMAQAKAYFTCQQKDTLSRIYAASKTKSGRPLIKIRTEKQQAQYLAIQAKLNQSSRALARLPVASPTSSATRRIVR